MFSLQSCLLSCVILLLFSSKTCIGDIPSPSPPLVLYIPNEPDWTDVLIRRVGENLTLICELRNPTNPRNLFVWNIPENSVNVKPWKSDALLKTVTVLLTSSVYTKEQLEISDSGHYMCSSPPFSVTKYILVQPPGPKYCSRGSFWCGQRCMAAQYVCDGRADCEHAEDEDLHMCPPQVCARPDKLNCSTGRCISDAACCRTNSPLCQHPSCCNERYQNSRLEGLLEAESPVLFDDRHAPDDYGFIQSTIYTVTACALIFMLAVVLLVSAICKMHMKRAALRSYANAERATRQHYNLQYSQTRRFPPCYEASRLLEAEARAPASPVREPTLQCNSECPEEETTSVPPEEEERPGGLARLSSIFSSRYRQVPTQSDVELANVRSSSLNNSPTRNRTLNNYRSPTYCDLNTSEFYFTNPETPDFGRDLNYMATPIEYMRNRNNSIERVINQLDRQRLTLQLGRFQLTIPRFGRRTESDRRPDTPNVAEINIDDLDFVRMTSHDTYTLNGRTIRLLGANFENYPVLPDGTRPPPYNEAMRYKFFGPPPEYLSREVLNARVDEEARNNIEMPPCYAELNGENRENNSPIASGSGTNDNNNNNNSDNNDTVRDRSIATIANNSNNMNDNAVNVNNDNNNSITDLPVTSVTHIERNDSNSNNNNNTDDEVVQSISSIINNLPAIDSDVNANDTIVIA